MRPGAIEHPGALRVGGRGPRQAEACVGPEWTPGRSASPRAEGQGTGLGQTLTAAVRARPGGWARRVGVGCGEGLGYRLGLGAAGPWGQSSERVRDPGEEEQGLEAGDSGPREEVVGCQRAWEKDSGPGPGDSGEGEGRAGQGRAAGWGWGPEGAGPGPGHSILPYLRSPR